MIHLASVFSYAGNHLAQADVLDIDQGFVVARTEHHLTPGGWYDADERVLAQIPPAGSNQASLKKALRGMGTAPRPNPAAAALRTGVPYLLAGLAAEWVQGCLLGTWQGSWAKAGALAALAAGAAQYRHHGQAREEQDALRTMAQLACRSQQRHTPAMQAVLRGQLRDQRHLLESADRWVLTAAHALENMAQPLMPQAAELPNVVLAGFDGQALDCEASAAT